MTIPTLTTARLVIRPLAGGDLQACSRLFDEIGWGAPELNQDTRHERCREWLDWTIASYVQLARLRQPPYGERGVIDRATGELVGLIGLVPSFEAFGRLPWFGGQPDSPCSPEVGLFWALAARFRGRGYATEAAAALTQHALHALDLGRIVATTEHGNAASIAVMRRLGMHIESNPRPTPPSLQVVGILERPGAAAARSRR